MKILAGKFENSAYLWTFRCLNNRPEGFRGTNLCSMYKVILILVFGGLGVCCTNVSKTSTKVEPELPVERIQYYARYLESSQELKLEAHFFSDTARFYLPGGVFVGDYKLQAKKTPKFGWAHRFSQRRVDFDTSYVFRYAFGEGEGLEILDTIRFPLLAEFELATPELSKATGGLLRWQGQPLGAGERLILLFEDKEGTTFTINHTGGSKGPQLAIQPDMLKTLATGPIVLRIIHKKRLEEQLRNAKVVKEMEYYRKAMKVELVD